MMNKLISIPLDDETTIFLEASNLLCNESDPMLEEAGAGERVIEKSGEYLDLALRQIKKFSASISESVKGISDEVEVEFSVKLSADAGIIISSISTEASVTVKLKWTNS